MQCKNLHAWLHKQMENKTKAAIIITIILVVLVVGLVVIVNGKNKSKSLQVQQQAQTEAANGNGSVSETNPDTPKKEELKMKSDGTTREGLILSVNTLEISIDNTTDNPDIFEINGSTKVFKMAKDGTETASTVDSIFAGARGRVLYDQLDEAEKKVAWKIFLIEK